MTTVRPEGSVGDVVARPRPQHLFFAYGDEPLRLPEPVPTGDEAGEG